MGERIITSYRTYNDYYHPSYFDYYHPYGYNQGTVSTNRLYVTGNIDEKKITNEEFAKMIGFRVTTNKKVKLFY